MTFWLSFKFGALKKKAPKYDDYRKLKDLINKENPIYYMEKDSLCYVDLVSEKLDYCKHNKSLFGLDKNKLPMILIYPNCDIGKDASKLISTLAHEFGHYLSFKNKTMPSSNILAKSNNNEILSFSEYFIRFSEEIRAWKLGRDFLNKNGYELNYFYAIKCLYTYLYSFIYNNPFLFFGFWIIIWTFCGVLGILLGNLIYSLKLNS